MRWIPAAAVLMQLACAPSFADEWRPDLIAMYESSGGQNIPNFLFDGVRGTHSAGGVCQMLSQTWKWIAPTIDIDIVKFPVAGAASEFDQWRACWKLWDVEGYRPWTCCNAKLRQALEREGVGASPTRRVPSANQTKEKPQAPGAAKVASYNARLMASSDVYHVALSGNH
jgi:hypothetical protein